MLRFIKIYNNKNFYREKNKQFLLISLLLGVYVHTCDFR